MTSGVAVFVNLCDDAAAAAATAAATAVAVVVDGDARAVRNFECAIARTLPNSN